MAEIAVKTPTRRERVIFISKIVWVVFLSLLTAWLILGVGISVGLSQYHSYTRLERLPDTDQESRILDGSHAMTARRSLNYFYRDLHAQTKRTFRRMSRNPETALHLWNEWHEEWTADLQTFGQSYSFTRNLADANEHEKRLAKIYEELVRVEGEYHRHFLALGQTTADDQNQLHSLLEEPR